MGCIQLVINQVCISFIGKRKLIPQICKTVVDRGRRKHQHFCLYALTDHLVHQLHIAVFFLVFSPGEIAAIAEVMGFVDHHQVIVAPNQPVQVVSVGLAACTAQIRMEKNIIPQPIFQYGIVLVVVAVGVPVACQLFGAQNENRLVPVLVILDDRQGGKGFAQAHRIGQNAAIVLFQLVDDSNRGVPLEIVEQRPDLAFLKSRRLVGQVVL